MKILAFVLALFFCASAEAVPIPLRGVVEGFYGTPWTNAQRADILDFCYRSNLNAYIYAPKDDPYHREKWRIPYPSDQLEELERLAEIAHRGGVRFIFAVSPGLDINLKSDADFKTLTRKLDALYNVGVRDFAIFFDDLKDDKGRHHEDGKAQAIFLNRVNKYLRGKYKDVAPLITVPTEYFLEDMRTGSKVKPYTRNFAENLDPRIVVLFTGRGVVCEEITEAELAEVNKIFGREVGIWWNYPVNDYSLTPDGNRNVKLALGAIDKLPTAHMTAIFFNPMSQSELSKISLATGAIYANNPATYNAESAWDRVLREQFGSLAPEMKIFAEHSRRMENSWAKVGEPDAPDFSAAADQIIDDVSRNLPANFSQLEWEINRTERAVNNLLWKLPQKFLVECKPQLEQLNRTLQADKIAIESLKSGSLDPRLKVLRKEISDNERAAIISEKAALKFIDDVINFFDAKNSKKRHK